MKLCTNYRSGHSGQGGWLPRRPPPAGPPDFSHWLSRAARGYTWNADAADRRRRAH
jgi:hypothetical protein